ncbi:MAG: Ty3/Gypsy family RNase HI domain-containing protein, partial [Proteobacteria bacterium]|nr:Ty3/Gypsy family RNase HI domain-containing protein [Pseudomonadota bacterium]
AFQELKRALTEAPVLGYPTMDDQFVVDTDASLTGVGAVLSQLQDGQEKVIYYSSSLSKAEKNYCATRRELLAVIKALRRFHPYLYGRPFKLRRPCSSTLVALFSLLRRQYDFEIEHRPGARHVNADALSRRPCMHSGCKYCANLETKEELQRQGQDHGECISYRTTTGTAGASKSWSQEELRQA